MPAKFFFQFAFCAVSLAIVWGTTLERIKFGAYLIYAVVFSSLIYPVISHWIFGGGWLQANFGMQDFAGSTVIHLIGATGALAALLLLGPRQGKFGRDGEPNVIPGHSMPLVGLGVLILFVGWFGFNAGSTLGVADGRFAEVAIVTVIGAAGGVLGAMPRATSRPDFDIGMTGNGVIAGLVGITAPSGYVEYWAALPIGLVAGFLVVFCIVAIDKVLDDPIGALSAHGVAGVWGTLACGLFTAPRLAEYNAIGEGGLFYTGSFEQLGVQALGVAAAFATVFVVSYGVFYAIRSVRPARERGAGAARPRHRRARHVGLPGAVHAGTRIRVPPAEHSGCAGRRARHGHVHAYPGGLDMKKIEAIIRPERLQDVQDALDALGVSGLTVTDVVGCGRQKGYTEPYRGTRANISLLPKIKVESVVPDVLAENAVRGDHRRRPHRRDRRRPRVRLRDRAGDPDPHRRERRGHRAPRGG